MLSDELFGVQWLRLASHYGAEVDEAVLADAYELLAGADVSDDELRRMVAKCLTDPDRRFMPRVGELLGYTRNGVGLEVWGRVLDAMKRVGRYQSVDFGPVGNAAVTDCGGWQAVCAWDVDKLGILESKIRKAAEYFSRFGVPEGRGEPLAGVEELDRQRLGLEPPAPVLRLRPGDAPTQPALESRGPARALPPGSRQLPPEQLATNVRDFIAAHMKRK